MTNERERAQSAQRRAEAAETRDVTPRVAHAQDGRMAADAPTLPDPERRAGR